MPPLFLLAGGWDGLKVKASNVLLVTVPSAKAEVLLLKVIISYMSLILHCLAKSQTQASGGSERWAQGALTEEPVDWTNTLLLRELDTMLPAAQEALPFQPLVLLIELSL